MDNLRQVILFAGTTEGRLMAEALHTYGNVRVHVATEYGTHLLPDETEGYKVYQGRLDENKMIEMINEEENTVPPIIIDGTHPFATEVTENIKGAAKETGATYLRLLRKEVQMEKWQEEYKDIIIMAEDIEDAAQKLEKLAVPTLLTTGSKELLPFTKVKDFQKLLTVRILPLKGALRAALAMGFEGQHVICMQGPFSVEMNIALIRQTKAKVLVTKESGMEGGFLEKLEACKKENIKAIVIKRPLEECGYDAYEIGEILKKEGILIDTSNFPQTKSIENINESDKKLLAKKLSEKKTPEKTQKKIQDRIQEKTAETNGLKRWFPAFLDSKGKNTLIIGGGKIATRRAETLMNFQSSLTIWSDKVSDKIKEMEKDGEVRVKLNKFNWENLDQLNFDKFEMVIAATNDEKLNKYICEKAKNQGKLANNVSDRENCNFYFPAVSLKKNVTVGITSQGNNHKLVSQVRKEVDGLLKKIIKN